MKDEIAEIEAKITATIEHWAMFPQGCTVVAGLSGGADSVAMVHCLFRRSEALDLHLLAAHVNHGLRGEEADRDEQFAADFCRSLGIELKILHADVAAEAREKSQGIEECGREVRYSFFRSLCGPGDRIATAHTLTDNAETVLMNLTKGAGTKGLSGIPPVRGSIVRPLIGVTRREVEAYCSFYGLAYITDGSNFSDEFVRNKLRLRAVPVLREINPSFEHAVERTGEISRCDEAYFGAEAQKYLREAALPSGGYRLDVLRKTPRAVLMRVIALAAGAAGSSRIGYDHAAAVENVIFRGGATVIAGGVRCSVSGNILRVEQPGSSEVPLWSVPFSPEGTALPDGRLLEVRPVDLGNLKNESKINKLLFNNLINYDTIISTGGVVRNRQPGDVFRPAGRNVKKTLKKLLNETKIPVAERGRLALLECGGNIVWAEGFGVSQEACVSENSRAAAEIIVKECR